MQAPTRPFATTLQELEYPKTKRRNVELKGNRNLTRPAPGQQKRLDSLSGNQRLPIQFQAMVQAV